MVKTNKSCRNCRWIGGGYLECRRHAPSGNDARGEPVFPRVLIDGLWIVCGDWEAEEKEIEPKADTPPEWCGSALRMLRAASRLDVWLRENVGDNADWPVRLQCSDVATADALACLLSELGNEVRACLERGPNTGDKAR